MSLTAHAAGVGPALRLWEPPPEPEAPPTPAPIPTLAMAAPEPDQAPVETPMADVVGGGGVDLSSIPRPPSWEYDIPAEFRRQNKLTDILRWAGYTTVDGVNWRSPLQTSGTYATRVFGDRWVSLSGSDAAAGLGSPGKHGRTGDGFDLYAFFAHDNVFRAAVRAYAAELRAKST